ncbi:MAG TPA: M48 family metalloprotease [Candidatus Polarisedimenticolaceae bacterium]|nr:M48 family metalloprotease [Candidatus Polarisedimenticolaceae bacterium]
MDVRAEIVRIPTLSLAIAVATACVVNPATGKRQFSLVSESDEIQIGRETDRVIVEQMGLYGGDELQGYVRQVGERLAAVSERPQLDWTFRVVDDPQVNAFALPGGYIYITRGILAYLQSEAELATVVGHEIGHVTARHGADQMTKAQLTQAGLVLGTALGPDWARGLSDYAQIGAGLMMMKFGRDDERQADELGLRYMLAADYDARPAAGVFDMLDRVSAASGGGGTPAWLSTHPAPANRSQNMQAAVVSLERDFSDSKVGRQEYLVHIDGIVFGSDPREGYFTDQRFIHPQLRFRIDFPSGWTTSNTRAAVSGTSPGNDAVVAISHAAGSSRERALESFIAQEGIAGGSYWRDAVGGVPVSARGFSATSGQGAVRGIVMFVERESTVLRVIGYSLDPAWGANRAAIEGALASYAVVTDPAALGVEPARVRVVDAPSSGSLGQFARQTGATASVEQLALLNRMPVDGSVVAGRPYKTVTGGPAR